MDRPRLKKSFTYAFKGIKKAIRTEQNLRIHLTIGAICLILAFLLKVGPVRLAILVLTISSVITAEIFNTSIETVVDLASPGYDKLAGLAKDLAAGAVLVSAIFSVIIGIIIFYRPLVEFIKG